MRQQNCSEKSTKLSSVLFQHDGRHPDACNIPSLGRVPLQIANGRLITPRWPGQQRLREANERALEILSLYLSLSLRARAKNLIKRDARQKSRR